MPISVDAHPVSLMNFKINLKSRIKYYNIVIVIRIIKVIKIMIT